MLGVGVAQTPMGDGDEGADGTVCHRGGETSLYACRADGLLLYCRLPELLLGECAVLASWRV